MQTTNRFNQMANASMVDLNQVTKSSGLKMASELNCMRIAIVREFNPDDLTVQVQIAGKRNIGMNQDGTPRVQDYAPIYAKVCYCVPYATWEIKPGDECILLFSDREIESWFINGDINPEGYPRMHDLTDAVAIFGIRSLPNMITLLRNCLNLFYGNSSMQFKDNEIDITSALLSIAGNTTQTGTITATNLNATSASTGSFRTSDNKTVTVTNGIVTSIA